MDFGKLLKMKYVSYIISFLLGIGLSSLFQQQCKGSKCFKRIGPSPVDLKEKLYKQDNKCYQFKEKSVSCDLKKEILPFA